MANEYEVQYKCVSDGIVTDYIITNFTDLNEAQTVKGLLEALKEIGVSNWTKEEYENFVTVITPPETKLTDLLEVRLVQYTVEVIE